MRINLIQEFYDILERDNIRILRQLNELYSNVLEWSERRKITYFNAFLGSQVISEERRRVEELKRRVQDEVRSQWEERKMNCASFNSVESGEESSSYSTGPTER